MLATLGLATTPQGGQPVEERPEAASARKILRALEQGRVAWGVAEAEAAARRFPQDSLIRRRLAQAHLCLALQWDTQFDKAAEDAAWARELVRVIAWLKRPARLLPAVEPERAEKMRASEQALKDGVRSPANLAAIAQFQETARQQLENSGRVLERRSRGLARALQDVKEARRLGDRSAELELTDLWAQVMILLWQQEFERLKPPPSQSRGDAAAPRASTDDPLQGQWGVVEKALASLPPVEPDEVLRAAQALAKERPDDATALAGAADVIAIVAQAYGEDPPWLRPILHVLNALWPPNRALPSPRAWPSYEPGRQAYVAALKEKAPQAAVAPWTVALQLYVRAVEADPEGKLPYLRPRVYLLRRVFEPEEARRLLDEIARQQPQNALVPLERARAELLIEDRLDRALVHLAEAARRREFARSYLVAVPPALRNALRYQRGLGDLIRENWPDYTWAFRALGAPRAGKPHERSGVQLPSLRLQIADRLCGAPDYVDRADGIGQKALALSDMAELAERSRPAERVRIDGLRRQHVAAFAGFPRKKDSLILTQDGMIFRATPNLEGRAGTYQGRSVLVFLSAGIFPWTGDVPLY